jgi:two-component system, chemotaxis family, protein-glutamate methylesterase/glutaminase
MLLSPPDGFHRDIIAIGGSAGALDALCDILAQLPRRLRVSILVVMHRLFSQPSNLPETIARKSGCHVGVTKESELLREGIRTVSPPDRHLVMGPDQRIHLLRNGFYRPHNIDALFCSLAHHAGSRVIGIILTDIPRLDGAAQ